MSAADEVDVDREQLRDLPITDLELGLAAVYWQHCPTGAPWDYYECKCGWTSVEDRPWADAYADHIGAVMARAPILAAVRMGLLHAPIVGDNWLTEAGYIAPEDRSQADGF